MTILDEILQHKRREVAEAKERRSPDAVRRLAEEEAERAKLRFDSALRARKAASGKPALIAEVKKASPSKGVIRPEFDPAWLAVEYARAGAAAVSVLTDARYFQGGLDHLDAVRRTVDLPVLRKEFIIDPYQIYEARAHRADAVLLIVAALEQGTLTRFIELARALALDALVEVHTKEELQRALDAGATLVGINNRDLRTFVTTLDVTRELAAHVPEGVTLVSESGISTYDQLQELASLGVEAVLVGEALAKEPDVAAAVRRLLGEEGLP